MSPQGQRKRSVAKKGGTTAKKTVATKRTTRAAKPAASTQTGQTNNAAGPKPSSAGEDAVALLRADHRAVEKMFAQHASASDEEKAQLTQQICRALSIHARLEDELFYPACREHGVDAALMDEAQVEHDAAAVLIEELMRSDPGAPYHDAKVKVLSEYIQMHVREEEKPGSGIFAKVRKAGLDMSGLGQRMQSRKQELEAEAQARGVHPPSPRTLGTEPQQDNGESSMARFNQERDEQGRFVGDDDRRSSGRDREDDRRNGRSGNGDGGRASMRDDRNDDDRGRYSRGRDDDDRGRYSRGRDDDDRGGSSRYRSDDRGQSRSGQGWHGDPEGHSRAAQRGWDSRRDDDDDRGRSSRSRSDDDDRGGRGRSGDDRSQGGWFGDSEGHSRAAQRGWETRRDDDDDRGRSSRSRSDDDNRGGRGRSGDDRSQGGWFGDSEGHSRAAQRGWETRRDDDDDRGRSSRSRSDDDDRGGSSRYRSDDGGQSRSGQGWHGDPEGHSRAAQRGWETRRDDDDDRGRSSGSRSSGSRSNSSSRSDEDDRRGGGRGRSDDDRSQGGWFGDSEGHSRAAQRGWESRRDDDRSDSRSGRGGR
jgi:hypothetical protein